MRLLALMILAFSFTADASEDWKADCKVVAAKAYLEYDSRASELAVESFVKYSHACSTKYDYKRTQEFLANPNDYRAYSNFRMIVKMHNSRLEKKGRAFLRGK